VQDVRVTGEDWQEVRRAAQLTLDDLPAVIREVTRVIRETVPEYALVSEEQLSAATTRNITDLLTALRDRRHLTADELEHFSSTVEERARNGVAVEEYLLAVGTAEAEIWEQLWRRAEGISEQRRLEAFALRFANVQLVTRITVGAHRRIEVRAALQDQERRAVALRLLLRGGLPVEDAREHLARLGLLADRTYYVVRARPRSGLDGDRLPQLLVGGPERAPHAAFALWGDDTVGLVRERPTSSSSLTAGVAGPVEPARLPSAHDEATNAFETAWALGLEGTHSLADLGLRAAVHSSPEVGLGLRERYLAPLLASGTLGEELLATTRAYLESGSSREAAAARLHVHQNTVGYRLNRFTELTGADLSRLSTLAELHWLFTDLELRPPG
jgi:hypothetical protein